MDAANQRFAYYLEGPGVDQHIARNVNGQTYTYVTDPLGTTRKVIDSAGSIANSYSYKVFGYTRSKNEQITNPYLFTGRRLDSHTNEYYYRARYYQPGVGMFTGVDRQAPWQQTYGYAAMNPLYYTDPSGEFVLLGAIGIGALTATDTVVIAGGLTAAALIHINKDKIARDLSKAADAAGNAAGRVARSAYEVGKKVYRAARAYNDARKAQDLLTAGDKASGESSDSTGNSELSGSCESTPGSPGGGNDPGENPNAGSGNNDSPGSNPNNLPSKRDSPNSVVPHGNSRNSPKPQHGYRIITRDGEILEYGISGQRLNKNGTSPRIRQKIRTKYGNDSSVRGEILETDIGNRNEALDWEQQMVDDYYQENGYAPENQLLPKPSTK